MRNFLKRITKTQLLKITNCEDEWNDSSSSKNYVFETINFDVVGCVIWSQHIVLQL